MPALVDAAPQAVENPPVSNRPDPMARRRSRSSADDLAKTLPRLLGRRGPWWVTLLLVTLAVLVWYFDRDGRLRDFGGGEEPPAVDAVDETPEVDAADDSRTYRVERVVDGDTIVLAGGERVRLLGVNTPETVAPRTPVQPMGPEASAFTKRLLEGKTVRLGYDKERRDRYGRMLAYVYLGDRLVNEEIIRAGFSPAETQYPYKNEMKRRFRDAEAEAKAAGRGVWSLPEDQQPGRRKAA